MTIEKTIGYGGDYASIRAAYEAYFVNPFIMLDDDYIFTIASDFTESVGIIGETSCCFNGHSVKFINPNGYKISLAAPLIFRPNSNGAITDVNAYIEWEGLNIECIGNIARVFTAWYWAPNIVVHSTYKNLTMKGYRKDNPHGETNIGIRLNASWTGVERVLNCRLSNFLIGIDGAPLINDVGISHIVENCSIHDCGTGINLPNTSAAKNMTIKNTAVNGCDTVDFASGGAENVITNCADSDNSIASSGAILSGNITGIVDGDFLSVTSTDDDFLLIDKNSALFNAGSKTLSAFNTADINGKNRPYQGRVSIGVNEPEAPMVPTFQKLNLLLAKNQTALGTKAPSALTMTDQSAVDDTFSLDYVKEFQDQNLAQAIFGQPQAVGGSSYVDVKVTLPIIPTGSATLPNVARYLNCCGMLYGLATKKHSWTPSSAVNTAWKDMSLNGYTGDKVAGDSILTKVHSAMFDFEMTGEVGKPVMITFTGKGIPDGVPAAASYLTDQLTPLATVPPAMLKNATQTINGIAYTILKFTLKGGIEVQLVKSAADDSGNLQAMITGMASSLATTVYMEDQSAKNPLTTMAAGTLATTTMKFGNATDYLISLVSGTNKSEFRSPKMSSDNGMMCWDLETRFVDNNYTLSINDAA